MEPKSRTILFLIVSFLLGSVAGGFVGAKFLNARGGGPQRHSRGDVMKEFTEKLRLQGNQIAVVDSILESHRTGIDSLRKKFSEQFKTQRDSLRKAIRAVLTPEQNSLYEEYIKEMNDREAKYRRGDKR